jgi:hypothetical protein
VEGYAGGDVQLSMLFFKSALLFFAGALARLGCHLSAIEFECQLELSCTRISCQSYQAKLIPWKGISLTMSGCRATIFWCRQCTIDIDVGSNDEELKFSLTQLVTVLGILLIVWR